MHRLGLLVVPVVASFAVVVFLLIGGAATTEAGYNLCISGQGVPGASSQTKPEMVEVTARALRVAAEHNASERVMIATIMTIDVESKFDPTLTERESDRDSSGAMQQRRHWVPRDMRPSAWSTANHGTLGWTPDDPRVNLEWTVANFLDPKVPGIRGALYWDEQLPASTTPGQLAQRTQVSAFPERYDQTRDRAESLIVQAQALLGEKGEILPALELCHEAFASAPIIEGAACPVGEPHNFTNTWGAPRSGGRSHQGVDIFADIGIPLYAYQGGEVRLTSSRLGGTSLWITTDAGDRYYYAHLSRYAPGIETGSIVETGQLVGYNGNTGNARFTPPHLHWEIHPANRNGAVDPTPYASAVCSGG